MELEVLTGLTEIMDQQAEARRAAFVAIENEKSKNFSELDGDNEVGANVELEKAEISYDDEEIEGLKEEMDVAEQAWLKKRDGLKEHQSIFKKIFFREHHLGQADGELADLEDEYKKAKARYEAVARIHIDDDVADLSMDDIETLPADNDQIDVEDNSATREIFELEDFIEKSQSRFREISDLSETIFHSYPELRGISKIEANKMIELFPEVIKRLNDLQGEYKEFYRESWMALFDNKLDSKILDMNAIEYFSNHAEDRIVKVLNILNSDEASFAMIDPMPNETVAVWSRRLLSFMLKSK